MKKKRQRGVLLNTSQGKNGGMFCIPRRRNTGKVDLDFGHGDIIISHDWICSYLFWRFGDATFFFLRDANIHVLQDARQSQREVRRE